MTCAVIGSISIAERHPLTAAYVPGFTFGLLLPDHRGVFGTKTRTGRQGFVAWVVLLES